MSIFRRLAALPLAGSMSIYLAASIAAAGLNFAGTMLFTFLITPEDIGVFAIFLTLLGVTSALAGLAVHAAVMRRYFDRDMMDFPVYVFNAFLILLASFSVIAPLVLVLGDRIEDLTAFPADWMMLVVMAAVAQFVTSIVMALAQVMQRPLTYAVFQIGVPLLGIVASVALVRTVLPDWQGRVIGHVTGLACIAGLSMLFLLRHRLIRPQVDPPSIRHALKVGVPFVPHLLGWWVIGSVDRLVLGYYEGLAAVGVYAVAFQFALAFGMLNDAVNKAWMPWLFNRLKEGDAAQHPRLVQISYLMIGGLCVTGVVYTVAVQLFVAWVMPGEFAQVAVLIPWLVAAYCFEAAYKLIGNYIFYAEKTYYLAIFTFLAGLVHTAGCFLLVPMNGMVGAAQSALITYGVVLLCTWVISARVYPMPWLRPFAKAA